MGGIIFYAEEANFHLVHTLASMFAIVHTCSVWLGVCQSGRGSGV